MLAETITWTPVAERLPDADLTVLLAFAGSDEDTCEGFLDGTDADGKLVWRDVTAVDLFAHTVTHWAEKPKGPNAC